MNEVHTETVRVEAGSMIPDVLRHYPQARPVFDRYGLRGCGGPLGPVETVEFFARAHDVPLGRLLAELNAAIVSPEAVDLEGDSGPVADTIYRPFFKAGIAVALTLGAVWGAWLLVRIALYGSFTAVGIHEVNAHGHAQIFGWVGLFVMGFAYQAFPRFKHTSLRYPRLALATLVLMLGGLVLRSASQALVETAPWLAAVGIAASLLEIVAIALFVFVIARTLSGAPRPLEVHDAYIFCALGWFLLQAVYGTVYFAALTAAPSRDALLGLVATWQAPLRDIQIHGFILLMILGVSHRIFHPFYGLPAPRPRVSGWALAGINLGVAGEATGFVLMRNGGHAWAALWYAAVLLLAGSVFTLVASWKLHRPSTYPDRSLKFLRTAYAWLLLSLAMLALLPLYQFALLPAFAPHSHAAEIGFSHAYYGAIRHAITVGFASLMIMGVAAKVVPTLGGIGLRALPALWAPFILINTGCAMRVGFQTLTDFNAAAFPFAGASGLLEVTALTLWGVHLWRLMNSSAAEESGEPLAPGALIAGGQTVGRVLDAYPQLLPVFLELGFTPLRNPVLRATLARTVRLETAARMQGVDLDELLTALNMARVAGVGAHRAKAPARLAAARLRPNFQKE